MSGFVEGDGALAADGLPRLRDVIATHGLAAYKGLGQNFLLDLNLTGKIARAAAPLSGHTIIEVGPGPGGLTRALLQEGARNVVVIERDRRCLPALEDIAGHYPGRLRIIAGDALRLDPADIAEGPVKIVANLPYNIATALLMGWITKPKWPPPFDSLTLMFQREVAHRLTAQPGSKAYGRLSVITRWRLEAKALFDIPARAFTPQPKVTSTLVQLVPRPAPSPACRVETLERVTAAAFGQRRKMLKSSLATLSRTPEALLAEAGIDGTLRAEKLELADFARLAIALDKTLDDLPGNAGETHG